MNIKGTSKNKISKMAQLEVYSFATISLRLKVLWEPVIIYSDENTILLKVFRFFLQMKSTVGHLLRVLCCKELISVKETHIYWLTGSL